MDIAQDASLQLYTDLSIRLREEAMADAAQLMMLRLSLQLKIPLADLYVMAFEMGLADKLKN
jgi:hypothetical protein